MSLASKTLVGLALGILAGVFFGESVGFLEVVGNAFIQLLQMTVLPYVTVSLVAGLGSLNPSEATSLGKKCGVVLLVLWGLGAITVVLMPLAFPDWESASFFSTTLVEERKPFDFLTLYIPANPFYSLTHGLVPAVVIFSIAMGVALMSIDSKRVLLEPLTVVLDALSRITTSIVGLAPYGVFALVASAAGTLDPAALGRLEVYLVTQIVAALVLIFWVLPGLVTSVTPLPYRDVVLRMRAAFITAFATGNLFIILPLLAEGSKALLAEHELQTDTSDATVDIIVPTAFAFPTAGVVLTLGFVPFAAWFVGADLSPDQYPAFMISGVVSLFAGTVVAIPFLFDQLQIPADMFQLFLAVDVFGSRFGTVVAAMHIWVLTLLGTCALAGRLQLRWRGLLRYAVLSLLLALAGLGAARGFFNATLDPTYTGYRNFIQMGLEADPVQVRVYASHTALPAGLASGSRSALGRVQRRGSLRVCYFGESLPFVFKNEAGSLVGLDVEMAHILAGEMGVTLDFVRIERTAAAARLRDGSCDVVMSGLSITTERSEAMGFSEPYMEGHLAFLVQDHRRDEFATWAGLKGGAGLKVGVPGWVPYYVAKLRQLLPQATIVPLGSFREYFRPSGDELDAMLFFAEAGSAWTLVYPSHSVVVPQPHPIGIPLAYAVPLGDQPMLDFMSTWVRLKKSDKTVDRLYDRWILGKAATKQTPRWSIIRNVLHWVD